MGIDTLVSAINASTDNTQHLVLDELLAFATSAIREASNCDSLLQEVIERTGVDLQVLSGDDEAQFTFLAARRWFGWSAGDLLVLDIGGGSLEIARGREERANFTRSVMLGAGRLTRMYLEGDPFTEKSLQKLEDFIVETLKQVYQEIDLPPSLVGVGTSKTFRTLDKLSREFIIGKNSGLTPESINEIAHGLVKMSQKERGNLPGVSQTRANQIVAGALVAKNLIKEFKLRSIQTCPWALREGIVLRRLDWIN
jgi:exopolyphosphatase/guanosine-5'-triphosphate,3'-diphosphate pyrophosphatase